MEGIFFAKLVCEQNGKTVEIDARTSDSIALAVRFNCPVSTYEFILSSAGIVLEDDNADIGEDELSSQEVTELIEEDPDDVAKKSISDLELMLDEAIRNEDYERASLLRDEINKRKSN